MQGNVAKPVRMSDLHAALKPWLRVENDHRMLTGSAPSPELARMYRQRLDNIAALFADAAAPDGLTSETKAQLRNAMHQLAGTAGLFESATTSSALREIYEALEAWSDEQWRDLIRGAAERFTLITGQPERAL